ncbi:MAG: RpiB/LacA/LacB family sugar-phosphate isomerase [Steroidobacteraceae bacterium]
MALSGGGFGASIGAPIGANEIPGVRAELIDDEFSAHQNVEDDDMNVLCLGGKVIGPGLALELVETFLHAYFSEAPRHQRRWAKVKALETGNPNHDDPHSYTGTAPQNECLLARRKLCIGRTDLSL